MVEERLPDRVKGETTKNGSQLETSWKDEDGREIQITITSTAAAVVEGATSSPIIEERIDPPQPVTEGENVCPKVWDLELRLAREAYGIAPPVAAVPANGAPSAAIFTASRPSTPPTPPTSPTTSPAREPAIHGMAATPGGSVVIPGSHPYPAQGAALVRSQKGGQGGKQLAVSGAKKVGKLLLALLVLLVILRVAFPVVQVIWPVLVLGVLAYAVYKNRLK